MIKRSLLALLVSGSMILTGCSLVGGAAQSGEKGDKEQKEENKKTDLFTRDAQCLSYQKKHIL